MKLFQILRLIQEMSELMKNWKKPYPNRKKKKQIFSENRKPKSKKKGKEETFGSYSGNEESNSTQALIQQEPSPRNSARNTKIPNRSNEHTLENRPKRENSSRKRIQETFHRITKRPNS